MNWMVVSAALAVAMVVAGCQAGQGPEADARQFIREYEATVRPVEIRLSLAWWDANISGKDEDFAAKEKLQNRLDELLANPATYARLERIRKSLGAAPGSVDPVLMRQVEVLRLAYMSKQLDPELLRRIAAKENAIEQAFNTFRARVDGQAMTDGQVARVLKESLDSAQRRKVWEASKDVGGVVQADLKELVKLRNQAARQLGFANFHEMQFQLNELDPRQVLRIFDELHELTREPFRQAKAEIDARFAARYGVAAAELRPWHYHDKFFQEPQAVYDVDLDACFANADIPGLTRRFYAGIGLPVDGVMERSDLYEKPGKSPHGFCSDADRAGDIRVLENIVPGAEWMGVTLHEFGHAVYGAPNIPMSVPYVLRTPAHSLTTEGLALMFDAMASRADWIRVMGIPVTEPQAAAAERMRRSHMLIYIAWTQVMVRFEMAMYQNPDQDLNRLWWDLVEKYQLLKRPEGRDRPDYASKIHICVSPCYYQNYTLGQLFASQLHRTISREVLKTDPATALYNGRPEVGRFLRERVFAPGATLRWDAFVRFATGEELGAGAFAEVMR